MNKACSATEGELATPATINGILPAAEGRDVDRVVADTDPCDDLHVPCRFKLGFAETGRTERNAMNRRMRFQQRLKIGGRNQIWKFNEFDIVSLAEEGAAPRRHGLGDKNFLLVGCHCRLLAALVFIRSGWDEGLVAAGRTYRGPLPRSLQYW